MRKFTNTLLSSAIVLTLGFCLFSQSSQAIELTVLGGLSRSTPDVTPVTLTYKARNSYAGGALLGLRYKRFFGIETGAIYANNKFGSDLANVDGVSVSGDTSFNSIQIPLLLRFTVLPLISFGVGGYYSMGIGQVSETLSVGGAPAATATSTYADAGLKTSDYGFLGDVRIRLPLIPTFGFILDFRYLYGFGNLSADAAAKIYLTDMQAFAGLQFGL